LPSLPNSANNSQFILSEGSAGYIGSIDGSRSGSSSSQELTAVNENKFKHNELQPLSPAGSSSASASVSALSKKDDSISVINNNISEVGVAGAGAGTGTGTEEKIDHENKNKKSAKPKTAVDLFFNEKVLKKV
jgi:hypothetical protein